MSIYVTDLATDFTSYEFIRHLLANFSIAMIKDLSASVKDTDTNYKKQVSM